MSTVDLISNCSSEHPFVCQLSDPGLKIIFFVDLYNSFNIAFVLVNSSLVRFDNFAIHWTQFIMIYTCVVKWLYSELFLIRSRSSRSTPVLRPWKFTSWNLKPTLLELQSKQYHTWCPRRMLHHNHHLESTRFPHKAVRMTFPVSKSSHAPRILYSMFSITCVLWKSQSRMGTGWPHRIEPHLEQNCWSAWKLKRSLKRPNKKLLNRGCKDPQKTIFNFITCTDGASPCWTRGQRQ